MSDLAIIDAPVSRVERTRFKKLDELVQMHGQLFVHVGQALKEIRDARLYREGFVTFEEYVAQRCGWTRRRADQLIIAASVVKEIKSENENSSSHFSDETAVRPLVSLAAVDRLVVLDTLRATHPDVQTYTAKHVTRAIAACHVGTPAREPAAPTLEATARRIAELVLLHAASDWPALGKMSLRLAEQLLEARREH